MTTPAENDYWRLDIRDISVELPVEYRRVRNSAASVDIERWRNLNRFGQVVSATIHVHVLCVALVSVVCRHVHVYMCVALVSVLCWQLVKEVYTFRPQSTHYVQRSYNAVTIKNDPFLRSLSVHITDIS